MKKKLLAGFVLGLFVFGMVRVASATNIGFTGTIGSHTYSEDGYTISKMISPMSGLLWGIYSGSSFDFSTNYLNVHDHGIGGSYLILTNDLGGLFTLESLEFQILFAAEEPLRIKNDLGGKVDLLYNSSRDARLATFDSNWSGLSWISFDSAFDLSIANINLSESPAPVPEPSTLLLLVIGLSVFGLYQIKNRSCK